MIRLGLHNPLTATSSIKVGRMIKIDPHHSVKFGDSGYLTVFVNENYNKTSLKNDIALVTLNKKVAFNQYVRPICLPPSSQLTKTSSSSSSALEGNIAYIAGNNNLIVYSLISS